MTIALNFLNALNEPKKSGQIISNGRIRALFYSILLSILANPLQYISTLLQERHDVIALQSYL